jgi:hypothetical protein
VKYDSVMASCCWHNGILVKNYVVSDKTEEKTTCICINVNLRNISTGADL